MRALPRYDAHTHTRFSDGRNSVLQMARAAEAADLDCVVITDHYRPGDRWVEAMLAEVEAADAACQVKVLAGLEVAIADADGVVHLEPDRADSVDLVLAELCPETKGVGTDAPADPGAFLRGVCRATVAACHNPLVDAIAHPLNVGSFQATAAPDDFRAAELVEMAAAFAATHTAFEICNQAYAWFPDIPIGRFTRQYAEIAHVFRQYQVLFLLGSDAHGAGAVGNLSWAHRVLELAGVPAVQVVDLPATGPRRPL